MSKLVKTLGDTPDISIEQLSISPSSFSLFNVMNPCSGYVDGGINMVSLILVVYYISRI